MILTTGGHERGVGLEIFFKSIICLPKNLSNKFYLFASKAAIEETLNSLNIHYKINSDSISLLNKVIKFKDTSINPESKFQSTESLTCALKEISNSDILFTLPTSKDQLFLNDNQKNGYTEFLREYFNNSNLTMSFVSGTFSTSLVTDHIPVSKLSEEIQTSLITQKVSNSIQTLQSFINFKRIIIAGLNPHAGEGGLIGHEDSRILDSIKVLEDKYPNIKFLGPLPADTMYLSMVSSEDHLVYLYHDQGLALFKGINGLIGANITCGLPFIRASVDHGTAFDLYGQNRANYQGCLYSMNLLASIHKK